MNSKSNFEHIESFLTLLFAVSVFVWKPGMYVSSGLITAYLLTRSAIDRDYARMVWSHPIAKASLAMFVLGLITSTIGAEQFEDIAWMARKTLFLPAVVFFVFALESQRNRKLAMAGLIGSFWVASLLTLNEYDWQLRFGDRMGGTWPIGTWDALIGLFFTFMVLSHGWTGTGIWPRAVHIATTLMALLMLILAGGRAPWIGALLSLGTYFVIKLLLVRDKRVLLLSIVAAALITTMLSTILEDKARPVVDRLSTVLNTTTEGSSNWIRLQLWKIGIAHLDTLKAENPKEFFFGGGSLSYDNKQVEFFKTLPFNESDRALLRQQGYPSGDAHNNYIDSALRSGVIWTACMVLYLIWLCTQFKLSVLRSNPGPAVLLLNLLVMGMFYTVFPHFLTLFFVLFAMTLRTSPVTNPDFK